MQRVESPATALSPLRRVLACVAAAAARHGGGAVTPSSAAAAGDLQTQAMAECVQCLQGLQPASPLTALLREAADEEAAKTGLPQLDALVDVAPRLRDALRCAMARAACTRAAALVAYARDMRLAAEALTAAAALCPDNDVTLDAAGEAAAAAARRAAVAQAHQMYRLVHLLTQPRFSRILRENQFTDALVRLCGAAVTSAPPMPAVPFGAAPVAAADAWGLFVDRAEGMVTAAKAARPAPGSEEYFGATFTAPHMLALVNKMVADEFPVDFGPVRSMIISAGAAAAAAAVAAAAAAAAAEAAAAAAAPPPAAAA
jgi:hypothetical protein